MEKLDKKDHQILFELDRNSRIPINKLAKKTRLSRDVVTYRIKQLEKKGVIKNYITILDFTKLGYRVTRLYLKLKNTTPEIEDQIVKYFVSQKNNLTVYKSDGKYDYAIGLFVRDLREYQKIYERFLSKFRTYVYSTNFSMFLDYVHFHRNYFVEKEKQDYEEVSTGSFVEYGYDKKDLQLLDLIKENSRISLVDLATKLKMTATGIKNKLKNLEKNGVIVAYKLLIDLDKIGYEYFKIDLTLEDINIIPELRDYIKTNPNIVYRNITVGGSDFEFDCEFKNQKDFYNMIDEIKSMFPKKIRDYFYIKINKIFRYSYFPEELIEPH